MSFPPSILRLHVADGQGGKRVRLWLPLFLVWPIALALGIALAPLVLVAAIILWPRGYGRTLLLAGPRLFLVYCCLNGLRVDVEDSQSHVRISLW